MEGAVVAQKREIRRRVLALRDAMSSQERSRSSYLLADRLIGHQWFYRAEALLCFVSFGSEIDTAELLAEGWRSGKRVFVPRIEGERMEFYRIGSQTDLREGYRGIREPDGTGERYLYRPEERVLMIMPGAAFDPYRNRLGYGKGFYDRYLTENKGLQSYTIAIGFACQQVQWIPCGGGDIRPYQILLQ